MECFSKWNVSQNEMSLKLKCLSFRDCINFTLIPCLPPGSLKTTEIFFVWKNKQTKTIGSLSDNRIAKSFYVNAVWPGLVLIEKFQKNHLMMISFAASRRPNYDIWRCQGWPLSCVGLFNQKKYLASKYKMLNDTLYQSQEISPIFKMS